ncbi:unnamed protein product [Brassicogethes aeneus]|uniref:Gem-associated protein 5 n=1 Tax=Brassicogethes aeneus TaxID=1431903 RepID=A0A9P0BAN1_BRAAE|nr:unnamed protein product [Brassicogethes aeneus]
MNELVIPPSSNWYETSIIACAKDNTLVYGARNDIVVVKPTEQSKPSEVRIITKAHSNKVISVNVNKNWGEPFKHAVTVSEDKIIKLWDVETLTKKLSHKEHIIHERVVGANFGGEDRVISVSENGKIVVWNILLNEFQKLDIFGSKDVITCISTCPHAGWLTAFGMKNGLVAVCDLRKNGKVLYKLRGHDKSVLSLAWCPAPVNIFPSSPRNTVGEKKPPSLSITQDIDQICEQISVKLEITTPENEVTKKKKENPWINLKHADDDEVPADFADRGREKPIKYEDEEDDFLKECLMVKKQILGEVITDIKKEVDVEERKPEEIKKISEEIEEASQEHTNDDIKPKDMEIKEEGEGTEEASKKPSEEIKETIKDEKNVQQTQEDTNEDVKCKNMEIKKECKYTEEASKETTEEIKETMKVDQEDDKTIKQSQEDTNEDVKCKDMETKEECEGTEEASKETSEEIKETIKDVKNVQQTQEDTNEDVKFKDMETIEENKEVEKKTVKETNEEAGRVIHIEEIEEEPRKEFLLASSARESNIYIWRAGTDGRMQTFVTVPNKQNYRRSGKNANDKIWISLCWPTATTLLSSSKSGELLEWSLPKKKDKDKHYKLVHKDHNTMLFSIAAPFVLLDKTNWKSKLVTNAWTVGLDRNILNTSLTPKRTTLSCLPTFGGPIHCISASPVDPNRVAFGSGEGIIKVWDMSKPHTKHVTMAHFYHKIQAKVTSMAWHPDKELMLAYATHEGRIGIFDSSNCSKTPTLFKHYFKGQIHRIEFGPLKKNSLGIFAVAEGKLVVFDVKNPDRDPVEVETPDDTFVYMFAWKPDLSKLVVSTKAQTLLEYDRHLKLTTTHYLRLKFDQILWHPDAVNNNDDASKYSNCFAATLNSKEFVVYDTDKSDGDKNNEAKIFKGFEENVNAVSWSPFNGNHIVSVGEDGVAQVWDVGTKTILATHVHEGFEPILSAIWSPVNEDCIIIGGKNYVTSVWKISENPPRDENDLSKERKAVLAAIQTESGDLLPKTAKLFDEIEKAKPNKPLKKSLLPAFYNAKDSESHIDDLKKLFAWSKEKSESCSVGKSGELDSKVGSLQNDILKIYGTSEDMADILNTNLLLNRQKGKYNNGNIVALMKGDMKGTVLSAIEEKRVNPWIISVSPMISTEVWLKSCATYVEQLKELHEADPLEITTYLLAQHKVSEAVDILCEHVMFREALALAKCRLIGDVKTVEKINEKWAANAVSTGQFELAAQCYIFLNQYEKAAMILYRRTDQKTLEFAAELAKKSGNTEMHDEITKRLNIFNPVGEPSNLNPDAEVFVYSRENSDDSAHEILMDEDLVVVDENDVIGG